LSARAPVSFFLPTLERRPGRGLDVLLDLEEHLLLGLGIETGAENAFAHRLGP
jgi:hypothetical protein